MIKNITSRDNKIIKLVHSLNKKSGRTKHKLFIAEGKRIATEAILYQKEQIAFFLISDSFYEKDPGFVRDFECYKVPDNLFSFVCDTKTPQGVLAAVHFFNEFETSDLSRNILILDGVSEPGNMGTILRTADAMGFEDIFIMKGSADIFSPKVVRSTMGSIFRLRFHFEDNLDFIKKLKDDNFKIISTALYNSVSLETVPIFEKNAIIIGNEADGVSKEMLETSDFLARIDMAGRAESLNASIAAGIVMYRFSVKEG